MKKLIATFIFAITVACSFAAESPDITVFRPAVNPRNKNDVMVKAKNRYEKEVGGKVKFVIADWGDWQTKVLSYMAVGEPIDVIFAGDSSFPLCYTKGYLQPLENYVNMNYKYVNKYAEENCYKYNGHYYILSNQSSNHYWCIHYNKSLMEEEGIKESEQPYALWKAGKWDWSHFAELARKLTKDTTGSGAIDRWGFGNWYTEGFIYMNGTTLTTIDDKGNATLNFSDPRLVEALTFLEQAKKEGWYQQDSSLAATGVQSRTVAMYMEREYFAQQIVNDTDDEIGFVPLPTGPAGNKDKYLFECDGYGIGNGSKNPTYAGKFIEICLEEWHKYDEALVESNPIAINDLTAIVSKNPWYPNRTANSISTILSSFLGEIVWTGNSPSTAIEKWQPKAQALVQDANVPMDKIVRLNFKTQNENFNKEKDLKAFPLYNPDNNSKVKLSYAKGKDAIDKGSLLVTTDYETEGMADITATITDKEQFGMVGWREYIVEFDIKALKQPGEDGYVFAQGYYDDLNQYGWIKQSVTEPNLIVHVKGRVKNVFQNGKISLKIGAHNMKDFVIDNLVIVEDE